MGETFTLLALTPDINDLIVDLYHYELKVKQGNTHIGTATGNLSSSEFSTEKQSFTTGLVPDRSYTVELSKFRHLKQNYSFSGIRTNDSMLQVVPLDTLSGNETVTYDGHIREISGDTAVISNLTVSNVVFSSDASSLLNYTLKVHIDGNEYSN
eukprot:1183709-Prorocentrum_minimum.AAC.2